MDPRTGAMYEINSLVWPLVYGVAGHAWGGAVGHPWLGVTAGVVLGIATAVPMLQASFYDVEIVAPFLLLALFFIPGPLRRWYLLALCALPWARLALARLRRHPAAGAPGSPSDGG